MQRCVREVEMLHAQGAYDGGNLYGVMDVKLENSVRFDRPSFGEIMLGLDLGEGMCGISVPSWYGRAEANTMSPTTCKMLRHDLRWSTTARLTVRWP